MKRDFQLGLERLDNKTLLSSNPWYIDTIKAPEVWASQLVVDDRPIVAIIDSGVDLNHPDLVPNLFHNRFDPIDGIDNDKNGLVDDYTGWNFANYNNVPQDGFYVFVERRFLVLKSNQIIVKIVDSANKLSEVVYKGIMKR